MEHIPFNENKEIKEKINKISERLSKVIGKPWKYEPELEMFIGSTNALDIYYKIIDLGRNNKEYIPYENEYKKGYRLSDASAKEMERIKSLGEFLENCREDIQFLISLINELN